MQCGYYSDIMNGQAREDFMAEETVTPVALRAPSVTVSCLFSGCRIHLRNLKNWFKKPGHLILTEVGAKEKRKRFLSLCLSRAKNPATGERGDN